MGARQGVAHSSDSVRDGSGIALAAIPLVVVLQAPPEPIARQWRWPSFTVPRIVDYLIVAVFMFFVL